MNEENNQTIKPPKPTSTIRVRAGVRGGVIIGKGGQEVAVTTGGNGGFNFSRR